MIWLQCKFDDDDSVLPKSFFVKRQSRPMEENRPKKLLDDVRTSCLRRVPRAEHRDRWDADLKSEAATWGSQDSMTLC